MKRIITDRQADVSWGCVSATTATRCDESRPYLEGAA